MLKKNAKNKDPEAEQEAFNASGGNAEGNEEKSGEANVLKSPSEKEKLLALLQTLKDLGINSIGDLEVKISRL